MLVKIFISSMNTQNILKFYGSKLRVSLDSSEYYDYDLTKNQDDYDTDVIDLTTPITYSSQIINSSCLDTPINDLKPWDVSVNSQYTGHSCNFFVERRPKNGWTLDFIFNREFTPWSGGSIFYYLGVIDDDNIENYADNNLSFGFTDDGRIKWEVIHYSGVCSSLSGYSYSYVITSGETPQLCTTLLDKDFKVTITFDRYKHYTDCNIENDGGYNDLITGKTLLNGELNVITGATAEYSYDKALNKKWAEEKDRRLGTLKIYLNGRPIYKLENWEEVIPSDRGVNPYHQIWGGGTPLMFGIHDGLCQFDIKQVKYYNEPLDFLHVRHNFLTSLNEYNFQFCGVNCQDDAYKLGLGHILHRPEGNFINTENNFGIIYRA